VYLIQPEAQITRGSLAVNVLKIAIIIQGVFEVF